MWASRKAGDLASHLLEALVVQGQGTNVNINEHGREGFIGGPFEL